MKKKNKNPKTIGFFLKENKQKYTFFVKVIFLEKEFFCQKKYIFF
jgi:hypothetical protein